MELDEPTYSNMPRISQTSKSQSQHKRGGIRLVITVCVLLFFSLLANAILTYLYCKIKLSPCPLPLKNKCATGKRTELGIQKNDRIYIFSKDKTDWISSRHYCQELGGDLVVINSQEEHKFLAKIVETIGDSALYWIGLTDAETEGVWLWTDKTPLKENLTWWAYPPDDWKAHNPLGEDCAAYYDGGWGDISCLYLEKRICELSCTLENP